MNKINFFNQNTCDYLRTQMTEMNSKIDNLNLADMVSTSLSPRNRSKSLSVDEGTFYNELKDEAAKIVLENHQQQHQTKVVNEENHYSKEDELDKTIVFFDLGCVNKEDINKPRVSLGTEKVVEELNSIVNTSISQPPALPTSLHEVKMKENGQSLKKFIEDQLNVKISSNELGGGEEKNCLPKSAVAAGSANLLCSVSSISGQVAQEPSVFDKFFKSFNNADENKLVQKQNEQNLKRIFELLSKPKVVKPDESLLSKLIKTTTHRPQSPPDLAISSSESISPDKADSSSLRPSESTNLIKFLLKIDTTAATAEHTANADVVANKIEAEPDKLDAALSIYNNCPTTLNKILLSTKNPIIVDTSHQPGNLAFFSF